VRAIESRAYQNGRDDTVFGGLGRDVVVGGAGNDMLDGNQQDDLIFGDQIFLLRRVVETIVTVSRPRTRPRCRTSQPPLPDALRRPPVQPQRPDGLRDHRRREHQRRPAAHGRRGRQADGAELPRSGQLRIAGSPQLDSAPWWAEYVVLFDDDFADADEFHSFPVDAGKKGAGSFGNDYIAGGPDNDLVFGQLGNDTIQGDGGSWTPSRGRSTTPRDRAQLDQDHPPRQRLAHARRLRNQRPHGRARLRLRR
jgi:Ca2+-binding RTX toxin-like protein